MRQPVPDHLRKHAAHRPAAEGMKYCPSCKEEQPLEDFVRCRGKKDGRGSYCLPCQNKKTVEYSASREEGYRRNQYFKSTYGLTAEEVDNKLASQNGLCAICHTDDGPFNVDHDHLTGAIRGIICWPCNLGLGNFKDDPVRLESALHYLKNNGK